MYGVRKEINEKDLIDLYKNPRVLLDFFCKCNGITTVPLKFEKVL